MKTTELQNELVERLAEAGFDSKWSKSGRRLYFAGSSVEMTTNGKPIRGNRAWLEFDDPATLDGVALRTAAKKKWHRRVLAQNHVHATLIAIELVDPATAKLLEAEIDRAYEADEPIGDLV